MNETLNPRLTIEEWQTLLQAPFDNAGDGANIGAADALVRKGFLYREPKRPHKIAYWITPSGLKLLVRLRRAGRKLQIGV